MNRADAWALVCEFVQNPGLRNHMRAVEIALRAYARKLGRDEELWGIVGLLHDFDYERWPNPPDHPLQGERILKERGYTEEVTHAIKTHADYLPDCPRVTPLQKALYACDELCGTGRQPRLRAARRHRRHDGQQRQKEDEVEGLRPQCIA